MYILSVFESVRIVDWTDGFQPHLEDLEGETERGSRPHPPISILQLISHMTSCPFFSPNQILFQLPLFLFCTTILILLLFSSLLSSSLFFSLLHLFSVISFYFLAQFPPFCSPLISNLLFFFCLKMFPYFTFFFCTLILYYLFYIFCYVHFVSCPMMSLYTLWLHFDYYSLFLMHMEKKKS